MVGWHTLATKQRKRKEKKRGKNKTNSKNTKTKDTNIKQKEKTIIKTQQNIRAHNNTYCCLKRKLTFDVVDGNFF